jgi:hypothetical protein
MNRPAWIDNKVKGRGRRRLRSPEDFPYSSFDSISFVRFAQLPRRRQTEAVMAEPVGKGKQDK